jgi:hypothetical protein
VEVFPDAGFTKERAEEFAPLSDLLASLGFDQVIVLSTEGGVVGEYSLKKVF